MGVEQAINIADLRALARARLPRMVFDYIDGGADDEAALRANEARLREVTLVPDALVDVSQVRTGATILGQASRLPFFISPTAASRLFHTGGELAVARAAQAAGIPYSLSTIGSATIEAVAAACPGPKNFQVYVWKDRGLVAETLARARVAGFTGLILTVDVPVAGNRERDPRNGFSIPPRITAQTAVQALARPAWLWDLLTGAPIRPENFIDQAAGHTGGIMEFINTQFDRAVTWDDAAWMAQVWNGPFAIKGIASAGDARRCLDAGATAVWVSNHGGRQLDASPATIDLLPAVAEAVQGRAEVIFDGGIRRGHDVVKALARGATSCALGRAYLWGLAAGGEAGVRRALAILEQELTRTLMLVGRPNIADVDASQLAEEGLTSRAAG
jgi:L-lactate dehydrogenase (cytochrome)